MVTKRGEKGTYVRWLQQGLRIMCCYNGEIDSTFGPATESAVSKYQTNCGLSPVDGIAGPDTWNSLMVEIKAVQNALKSKGYYSSGSVSGYANDDTYNSLLTFQGNNGLERDGRVGPLTRAYLFDNLANESTVIPMSRGAVGNYVRYLQYALKMLCCSPGGVDGTFGAGTETGVKKFQTKYALTSNGVADAATWSAIKGKILEVQQKLVSLGYTVGKVDGIATAGTFEALVKFQGDYNLEPDGQIGPATRLVMFGSSVEGSTDELPLKRACRGPRVLYLQYALRIMVINPNGTDGVFGPGCESAVKRYQAKKGMTQTGIVDVDTWEKLKADIRPIQVALVNKGYAISSCDGIATEDTYNAVLKYQTDCGMTPDGMVGPATRAALLGGTDGSGTVSYVQKLGSNGALTRYLQHLLNVIGYTVSMDGIFSTEMQNAVISFQTANGLEPDGQFGPASWTKIFEIYRAPVSGTGVEKFVNVAQHELKWGYHEDNSNNITPYGQWYGLNGNAWCAMFVSWCAYQAGISEVIVPKYAWCPAGVTWYKQKGRYHKQNSGYIPKIGDTIFFYNTEAGRVAHTGIVTGGTEQFVYTIEGNSSDGVNAKTYALSSSYIDGYGDNDGRPIHSQIVTVTEAEINEEVKDYFHDLLLQFDINEEITENNLLHGYSVPTGVPGLTLSVKVSREMEFNLGAVKVSVQDGEFTPEVDIMNQMSIVLGSFNPTDKEQIMSLFKTMTLSVGSGDCYVSFSTDATYTVLELGMQFKKQLEIRDGIAEEIGIEYKLTYVKPSENDNEESQAFQETMASIWSFLEENALAVVCVAVLIFLVIMAMPAAVVYIKAIASALPYLVAIL